MNRDRVVAIARHRVSLAEFQYGERLYLPYRDAKSLLSMQLHLCPPDVREAVTAYLDSPMGPRGSKTSRLRSVSVALRCLTRSVLRCLRYGEVVSAHPTLSRRSVSQWNAEEQAYAKQSRKRIPPLSERDIRGGVDALRDAGHITRVRNYDAGEHSQGYRVSHDWMYHIAILELERFQAGLDPESFLLSEPPLAVVHHKKAPRHTRSGKVAKVVKREVVDGGERLTRVLGAHREAIKSSFFSYDVDVYAFRCVDDLHDLFVETWLNAVEVMEGKNPLPLELKKPARLREVVLDDLLKLRETDQNALQGVHQNGFVDPGVLFVKRIGACQVDTPEDVTPGRLYAPFQNWRGKQRLKLRINGEQVAETDYSSLHPRMLVDSYYQAAGLPVRNDLRGDVHQALADKLTGWSRRLAKAVHSYLIGYQGEEEPTLASFRKSVYRQYDLENITEEERDERLSVTERDWEFISRMYYGRYTTFRHDGPTLWEYFWKTRAIDLQAQDAELILDVMERLQEEGIDAVVPVHDSLVYQARHRRRVEEVMVSAYRKRFQGTIAVTTDTSVEEEQEQEALPPAEQADAVQEPVREPTPPRTYVCSPAPPEPHSWRRGKLSDAEKARRRKHREEVRQWKSHAERMQKSPRRHREGLYGFVRDNLSRAEDHEKEQVPGRRGQHTGSTSATPHGP